MVANAAKATTLGKIRRNTGCYASGLFVSFFFNRTWERYKLRKVSRTKILIFSNNIIVTQRLTLLLKTKLAYFHGVPSAVFILYFGTLLLYTTPSNLYRSSENKNSV